jgi:hypothetical protein
MKLCTQKKEEGGTLVVYKIFVHAKKEEGS